MAPRADLIFYKATYRLMFAVAVLHAFLYDIWPPLSSPEQLTACLRETAAKLKETPCEEIRLAYNACLKESSRVACRPLKDQLEECTAKHLGKLD
jgi:hypothetical protein